MDLLRVGILVKTTLTLTFDITHFTIRARHNFISALEAQAEGVSAGDIADPDAEKDYVYPMSKLLSTTIHTEEV